MPAEVIEQWLTSGKPACILGKPLRPRVHPRLGNVPLSAKRGQAEAFYMHADNSEECILKKFHPRMAPDRAYLEAVRSVLPDSPAFACGKERHVLSPGALQKAPQHYYSSDLAAWVDNVVLMPRIAGVDWAGVAEEVRSGSLDLPQERRVQLCRALSEVVREMERKGCAHRDLSSGNVFIETSTWALILIDWDSAYHRGLTMPENTTCGTAGYTAPFAWDRGQLDACRTWHPHGDRFSLAILGAEFLCVSPDSPLTGEGGMFEQDEICRRSGPGIKSLTAQLNGQFPGAALLLERALRAGSYDECPAPEEWCEFCRRFAPPALAEVAPVPATLFQDILSKRRPAAPIWPAPSLGDAPLDLTVASHWEREAPDLPIDPWAG